MQGTRSVDRCIKTLRKKLISDVIMTVRQVGYMMKMSQNVMRLDDKELSIGEHSDRKAVSVTQKGDDYVLLT